MCIAEPQINFQNHLPKYPVVLSKESRQLKLMNQQAIGPNNLPFSTEGNTEDWWQVVPWGCLKIRNNLVEFGEGSYHGPWSTLKNEPENSLPLIRWHFIASLVSCNTDDKASILLPDRRIISPFSSLRNLRKRSLASRWAPAKSSLEKLQEKELPSLPRSEDVLKMKFARPWYELFFGE